MADTEQYLAVLKASYDYEPQSDDEVKIAEDQILLLLERTDDDWWKVKVKGGSPDEEGPVGLVPSAYVEPAIHTAVVKAQYDYAAQASGELSISEDQTLHAFGTEEDGWLLVQAEDGSSAGYVPANYVEDSSSQNEEEADVDPAPAMNSFSHIVVPDSPPPPARPVSTYVDPADLVASSKAKAAASTAASDPVETWHVSEVDKKNKKKKGTLGIGNGTLFFASEADKAPVRQVPIAEVAPWRLDENKPKHLYLTLSGIETHFNCGDRDTAEDIVHKLKKSRTVAGLGDLTSPRASSASSELPTVTSPERKGVHFSESAPAIIPVREEEETETDDDVSSHTNGHSTEAGEDEAIVLYDFQAQGDDELSVQEGDILWIVNRDDDEWWKVRNIKSEEGVVPASYIEPTGPSSTEKPAQKSAEDNSARRAAEAAAATEASRVAQAEEERKRKEREERKRAEAAASAAKAKADEERKRRDRETAERERRAKAEQDRAKSNKDSRGSVDKRGPPPTDQTRVWHDRTGQFRVEAAFLGYKNGMIRLHKVNGVVIEVPSEKMSIEDMRYIEKITNPNPGKQSRRSTADDHDDEPLAARRRSLLDTSGSNEASSSSSLSVDKVRKGPSQPKKKGPNIDWFEFFLSAGCDIDDCTRYASSFERDKVDAELLPDITEGMMRSLGLREGDIIRVRKAIDSRSPRAPAKDDSDQIRSDEELARQLQAEGDRRTTPSPGAPNLFTTNGQLKNTRRGRPQKSSTVPNAVDLNSITSASEQIQRSSTPQQSNSPGGISPTQAPQRTSSALAAPTSASSGFDDDAWTNRPSSTKPPTPSPAPAATLTTAPVPVPTPPAPPPSAPPAPTTAPTTSATVPQRSASTSDQPKSLAKTTESDIFDQLARLSQLRVQSPAAPAVATPPVATSPPVTSPPPASYNAGLGVVGSPAPLSQHVQAQQTGFLPPPISQIGPRGPLAPVPANQGLLQPLIPTRTGFTGFVPTGPQKQGPSPVLSQPTGFQLQPSGFQPQPTGFQPQATAFQPQPTGFQPQFQPQQTGFQPQIPLQVQPTGFQSGVPSLIPQQTGFTSGFSSIQSPPPVPPLPSFQGGNGFVGVQPQPTGFNPGFGQPPGGFGQQPQQQQKDTTPANVFAQMKAGTFGDDSVPQPANKYDALRTNTWSFSGVPGGYNGYQG